MTGGPGRTCPLHYRYRPGELARASTLEADTAWIVGGLYGNPEALDAILARVASERAAGLDAVVVFNGDFHWFDANPADFDRIQAAAMAEHALAGNIEMEIASPDPDAGCGCAYPDFVDDATVEYSNRIIERLRATARARPAAVEDLARLRRMLRLRIGDRVTGVIHGDPESVAGWALSIERARDREQPLTAARVAQWASEGGVDAFASTHTCLPWADRIGEIVLINNGSAGMPNFRGDQRVLVTRIAPAGEAHPDTLYAVESGETRWEAIAVPYDTRAWQRRFEQTWPAGSPARESYGDRMLHGPNLDPGRARPMAEFSPPPGA